MVNSWYASRPVRCHCPMRALCGTGAARSPTTTSVNPAAASGWPGVVCLGEVLTDFVALDTAVALRQATNFHKAPGGAPANVAVALARLGTSVAFIGKVGGDAFGES